MKGLIYRTRCFILSIMSETKTQWQRGWLLLVLAVVPAASAMQLQIVSFRADGTLSWTNDQTNVYCSIQYTPVLGGAWQAAPAPYGSLLVTNLSNSVVLPSGAFHNPQLFFRVVASTNSASSSSSSTYDVNANGIPQLVQTDYIEVPKISAISRFRSGEGHDYSDDFEHCRSMKHYFTISTSADPNQVKIFSPITGYVQNDFPESTPNSGNQIWVSSTNSPAFFFILFHVNVTNTLAIGSAVTNGQQIGTFGGEPGGVISSDIAVQVNTPTGRNLLSYFDVMPDALFANYQAYGITNRTQMIISQAERDADPLDCSGETFLNSGSITNQVILTPPL